MIAFLTYIRDASKYSLDLFLLRLLLAVRTVVEEDHHEQALVIKSHVSEIGKLNAVVRYLASKDSTLADILQSEEGPSHNSDSIS
ncbi:hypothetical protein Bca52824_032822 [Brassica carinata]|uniref:Uncharacterized protein n=1 Tax=Brassica carinata TaxID=52824 RepID=A0A8X7V7X0_BRACI|nr:hypothetical protein Bca52824_032822 [Brassica carinata]